MLATQISDLHFWDNYKVSVSHLKINKSLGLAEKNASLAVSLSLAKIIRHP